MKKLLLPQLLILLGFTSACSSFQQGGGAYRDSNLSNMNPAPSQITPPDYSAAKNPVLDDAYLTLQALVSPLIFVLKRDYYVA